jgi:hypothetical protein
MTARLDRIKERLSVLVGTGYMAYRLSSLALSEVDISWDDLSADDISQLAAWLRERQSATDGERRVEWTYILAAFASVRQVRDPASVQAATVGPDGASGMAVSAHVPLPLPTDLDGPARWKEELPLLSGVPSHKVAPVPVDRSTIGRQRRTPHANRSVTKGATHKRRK